MSWLRIDDGYDTHPKLLELTEAQRWRWTRVLIHCARHRTEGHVKPAVLKDLGLGRTVTRLLQLGLLESNGDAGYLVHDWSTFNPKDPTKAERQARWRATQASREPSTPPSTPPSTETAPVDDLVDAETVHSRVGARARPVPSRPKEPSSLPPDAAEGRPELDETLDTEAELERIRAKASA